MTEIQSSLFALADKTYLDFQSALIPNLEKKSFIGVRTPDLKKLAKSLHKAAAEEFLQKAPHEYFDENQLHAFLLCEIKDFNTCVQAVDSFLPHIDNWATCDQLSPKTFVKHKTELLPYIYKWIESGKTYSVRYGVLALMRYFLGEDFKAEYALTVANIKSEEYYVNMMVAWYFATALAKNYDETVCYLQNKVLSHFSHNKAIQKAVESYRIDNDKKAYLKTLKIK